MNVGQIKFIADMQALLAKLPGLFTSSVIMGYSVQRGEIYRGSQRIVLKGISHYGFNTPILRPMYLWEQGWRRQLAHIKEMGFNAVRCPFTPEVLYLLRGEDSFMIPLNDDLIGKTPLTVLDMWMAEANRLGLYILLDFHSPTCRTQFRTWFCDETMLTYNNQPYTKANWIRDLVLVARRYQALPYFMGIDLFNEPHGVVRWSDGDANMTDTRNYWKPAAEEAAAAVLSANPNLLVFVQGTESNWNAHETPNIPINYAENFQSQRHQPLNIPANKLVLSPHTYGPSVYVKSSFSAPNFPANLAADWDTLFGSFQGAHAVVPGEWGGQYIGQDRVWMEAFVDYMRAKGITSSFFWCYVNSGDTGALMEGSPLAVRQDKLNLLRRLWA